MKFNKEKGRVLHCQGRSPSNNRLGRGSDISGSLAGKKLSITQQMSGCFEQDHSLQLSRASPSADLISTAACSFGSHCPPYEEDMAEFE